MAGTVLQSVAQIRNNNTKVWVLTIDWTADAAAATVPSTAITQFIMDKIKGSYLFMARTIPSGVVAPTDAYDIVMNDADGVDVTEAGLMNRAEATTETIKDFNYYIGSNLTFVLTNNLVNAAKGTVRFYFVP